MITREELNEIRLNDYDPYTKTVSSLIRMAERLLAERDAYRELARISHKFPDSCQGILACEKSIDACIDFKAQEILKQNT